MYRVSENGKLRKLFEPDWDEDVRDWKQLHTEKFNL